MAKLRGGILGKVTGAVGNVVTASWKGINYARDRVIPANPRTNSQTRVRTNMRKLVLIGRAVKTTFIDTYWETLVRGTSNSGWAKFIGTNQRATQLAEDLENVKLATGDLEALAELSASVVAVSNVVDFAWSTDVVSNGSLNDVVYAYVFVPERNFVYSQSSSETRNGAGVHVSIPNLSDVSGIFYAYATVKKADGSLFSTTQGFELEI